MFHGIVAVGSRRTVVRVLRSSRLWLALITVALDLHVGSAGAQLQRESLASEVIVRALALIDAPYRYGGRTPAGFDCSGFVGYVFGESAGLSLPRRTEEIGRLGTSVDRSDLVAGDLVFFNTLGRRLSHVALYIGDDNLRPCAGTGWSGQGGAHDRPLLGCALQRRAAAGSPPARAAAVRQHGRDADRCGGRGGC